MANASIMKARDAVAGGLAQCYATIEGKRYNFMNLINFSAEFEKEKTKIPILGKTGKGNKAAGWSGTFEGTAHYNSSIFREMAYKYKETGEDIYFDMQVTNEDPTSAAGRQTVIVKDCNLDGGIIAKFDADAEYLDEDVSGTFEDFQIPEKFNVLDGML